MGTGEFLKASLGVEVKTWLFSIRFSIWSVYTGEHIAKYGQ